MTRCDCVVLLYSIKSKHIFTRILSALALQQIATIVLRYNVRVWNAKKESVPKSAAQLLLLSCILCRRECLISVIGVYEKCDVLLERTACFVENISRPSRRQWGARRNHFWIQFVYINCVQSSVCLKIAGTYVFDLNENTAIYISGCVYRRQRRRPNAMCKILYG